MARSDIHRPSEFIPADYSYVLSFSGATSDGGWRMPPFNVDRALEELRHGTPAAIHGGLFSCDICGAHYIHGDLWRHTPTGELVTLGHTCAEKYSLLADQDDYRCQRASFMLKALRKEERRAGAQAARQQIRETPGLARALRCKHYITRDLVAKLMKWGTLSPAQVALALKLEREADERTRQETAEAAEIKAPAPEGRLAVTGTVLGCKVKESMYGPTLKMLVKVETEAGSWKCWGTVPSALDEELKGRRVTFTAAFKPSDDDPSFAFFSRPTKASLVE